MSSPPPPPPPQHTQFYDPPPHNCCHCGKPLGSKKIREIARNPSLLTKEDWLYYYCDNICKEKCVDYWKGVCSFSSRPFSLDSVNGYTLRSPIPTLYKGIWGMVAVSSYASKDKENVFISVDGKTRIPLPPTSPLPFY